MKIYQAVQTLLVRDTQTDRVVIWKASTFIFGK
jgi:hypothetical protein